MSTTRIAMASTGEPVNAETRAAAARSQTTMLENWAANELHADRVS
jgi:hypothetical protein